VGKENVEKEQAGFVAEAKAEAEDLIYISQRGGGVVKSQVEVNWRRGLTCFLLVAQPCSWTRLASGSHNMSLGSPWESRGPGTDTLYKPLFLTPVQNEPG